MIGPDTLDTPVQTALARGWFGVNDRLKPALIGADELAELVNGTLDDTGEVRLRPGTAWLCQAQAATVRGLHYCDTPQIETVLKFINGKCYQVDGAETGTPATQVPGVTVAINARVQTAQLVERIYFVDGNRLQCLYYDGLWNWSQVGAFSDGSALPRFRRLCESGFRLWACGGTGVDADTVFVTPVLNGDTWLRAAAVRVGRGNGDPIEALVPGPQGSVFVLKQGSCWQIQPTGAIAEWTVEPITHQRGCVAAATAVNVNQDVLFLTRDGVASLSRLANDAPVAPVDLLSAPISNTIRRINWPTARRTACAGLWGEFYLLAVPLDGANDNNTVLAYNTRTQKWCGHWTGLAPQCFASTLFAGLQETLVGLASGAVCRLDRAETTDATGAGTAIEIPWRMVGRAETMDAPDLWKQPMMSEVEFRESAAEVDIGARLDGSDSQSIAVDYPATPPAGAVNKRAIHNIRALPPCREIQLELSTEGGAVRVREAHLKTLLMRARWEAPPSELLQSTGGGSLADQWGSNVALLTAPAVQKTFRLVEAATLTLDVNSDDLGWFASASDLPQGTYLLAYRDGGMSAPDITNDLGDLDSEPLADLDGEPLADLDGAETDGGHRWWGRQGLQLRLPTLRRAIAADGWGPNADGSWATLAALVAGEGLRLVLEFPLVADGPIALRQLEEFPGEQTADATAPTFVLYRLSSVESTAAAMPVLWTGYTLLSTLEDALQNSTPWTLTHTVRAGWTADALENAARWSLLMSRRAGSAEDPINTATAWTLGPDVLPPVTTPQPPTSDPDDPPASQPPSSDQELRNAVDAAIADGADLYDLAALTTDWNASGGFLDATALWLNSRGPWKRHLIETPAPIRRWFAIRPLWFAEGLIGETDYGALPRLVTTAPGSIGSAEDADRFLILTTPANWNPNDAWTFFIVAKSQSPITTTQRNLAAWGDSAGAQGGNAMFTILAGTDVAGVKLDWGAQGSLQFSEPIGTGWTILEISKAVGATISAHVVTLNGAVITPDTTVGGSTVPAWASNPTKFNVNHGFHDSPGLGAHRGWVGEWLRLNTTDSTTRTAARTYLAGKFGITLP